MNCMSKGAFLSIVRSIMHMKAQGMMKLRTTSRFRNEEDAAREHVQHADAARAK
jgi:hypothetical protein